MSECKVLAIANQKGGTGKTTTPVNLGIGLANAGKKVLLIDGDPQGNLTTSLGWTDGDNLSVTLATEMEKIIHDEPLGAKGEGILHHEEGVDLLPSNIELSGMEMVLVNAMSREHTLKNYLKEVKNDYDYVLIDCMPSLNMLTINALAAADGVIVPAIVREKEGGGYEMVAGHRRKMASEPAEKKEMPCIVRKLSDDEAILIMVDSNLQREQILPSEKAFAYKMKLEAMKRQGKRTDLTSVPMGPKLRSNEQLAKQSQESVTQIKRFIRLTELLPPILDMVDENRIALRPAVELSYQPKEDNGKTAGTSFRNSHAGQKGNAGKQTAQQRAARESTMKRATENRKKAAEQGKDLGKYSIKTIDRSEKTIKTRKAGQTIKRTGKGSIKSASRHAKKAKNSVKTTEKATAGAYRMAKHSAENSKRAAKAAKKAAQASGKAAKATEKAVKKAMKSVARAAKAILAGTKALFGILAAGGWVVVLVLIIVLLFGGLFSMLGGDNSTTVTPVSEEVKAYEPVIRKYAKQYGIEEYVELIKAVMMQESVGKGNDPMQSSQGTFNKKYPHKANGITDPEYSIECGVQELKSCLTAAKTENPMDIDHIKLALQGYNYGNGYIAWAEENYGGYTLANAAEFSEKMAKEKKLKSYGDKQYVPHVLRYYSLGRIPSGIGNGAIVQVALTQEGNGGTTYWSWYGFQKRVSWCACFVSWCADQCGYIESGVIPKFSLCSDGVKQFQQRKQFRDGSYVPVAGDITDF